MRDLKKVSSRLRIKSRSFDGINAEKICRCGHFDIPGFDGYCRDINCKRDRFIKDLHDGKAMMLIDGTIVWHHDKKITD